MGCTGENLPSSWGYGPIERKSKQRTGAGSRRSNNEPSRSVRGEGILGHSNVSPSQTIRTKKQNKRKKERKKTRDHR